ncbi:hypothetical protein Q6346_05330 [Isoptericola sp. b490]|nr:hypothetical protein [Isoptericola sp. b490]
MTMSGSTPAPDRVLGTSLIVAGLGTAAVAVLGPLVTGVIRYHASESAVAQVAGGDLAGLLLAAPVSIVAGVLVLRRHRAGTVLALAPAGYVGYTATQLALGGDVIRYPGNSERFFPLFLGLLVLAIVIAVRAWRGLDPATLPVASRRVDRTVGAFALAVAAFLVLGLHLPGLLDAWSPTPSDPGYLADPVVFWLVKLMDLGLVVPALVAVGGGALRGGDGAQRVRYAAVGWMALLATAVAGMALVMQARDDPAASVPSTVAFACFAGIGLAVAGMVFRPVLAPGSSTTPVGQGPGTFTGAVPEVVE